MTKKRIYLTVIVGLVIITILSVINLIRLSGNKYEYKVDTIDSDVIDRISSEYIESNLEGIELKSDNLYIKATEENELVVNCYNEFSIEDSEYTINLTQVEGEENYISMDIGSNSDNTVEILSRIGMDKIIGEYTNDFYNILGTDGKLIYTDSGDKLYLSRVLTEMDGYEYAYNYCIRYVYNEEGKYNESVNIEDSIEYAKQKITIDNGSLVECANNFNSGEYLSILGNEVGGECNFDYYRVSSNGDEELSLNIVKSITDEYGEESKEMLMFINISNDKITIDCYDIDVEEAKEKANKLLSKIVDRFEESKITVTEDEYRVEVIYER